MGMTVVEKILARAAGRDAVKAGDVLEPKVDLAMSHENAALVINQFEAIHEGTGIEANPWDPSRIAIKATIVFPAPTSPCKRRNMRLGCFISAAISAIASLCPGVSAKGSLDSSAEVKAPVPEKARPLLFL